MIEMDCEDVRIVSDTLTGKRPLDERSFASAAILTERLEKLKGSSSMFEGIGFSEHFCEMMDTQLLETAN